MKPFDRRLENDLFPKTPAAFRQTVKQTLADVCDRSEAAENAGDRFPPAENDGNPARKRSDLFTRIGIVAVAAVLVISLLAVGTIAVLARRSSLNPASSANGQSEATEAPITEQPAVIETPDAADGQSEATEAPITEQPAVIETPNADDGQPEVTETPEPKASAEPETENTVYAATVDEFLAAIAPGAEIILTGEIYNLTTAADYGTDGGQYYNWRKAEDGYELVLHDLEDFRLIGSENTQILTDPRDAAVIRVGNCTDLTFMNFTAGHKLLPYVLCSGPVLELSDCTNTRIENCGLFGCGRVGVNASGCSGLSVVGCDIYECSHEGIDLFECRNVLIKACKLRDCGLRKLSDDTEPYGAFDIFFIGSCEHIIIKDCDVFGNKALSVIGCAGSKKVFLYGTLVYDNELDDVISIEDAEMTVFGCEFRHSGNFLYKTSYPYTIRDQDGNEIGETELREMKLERDPYAN